MSESKEIEGVKDILGWIALWLFIITLQSCSIRNSLSDIADHVNPDRNAENPPMEIIFTKELESDQTK